MKKGPALYLKIVLVLSLVVGLLSGCGGSGPNVKESYPLESVNREGNSTSYVYRAVNETVPEVAAKLADQKKPKEMSAESDERMFLVYDKEYYHLQKDTAKPEDTLIEVDSEEYVRNNYDSSFLQGYLTATLIGSLFDSLGGYGGGSYRGYSSRDTYHPEKSYRTPTQEDKKAAPPLTVEKKGSITRRGKTSTDSGGSSWFGGGSSDSGSSSKGSISRNKDGSSSSKSYSKPKRSITKPKTRSGRGGISRRSRR
ncbi:DUF4247 domain-containing protein [Paenibacillus sp. CAA11]|uniref:DUF4247 domain-containing protein n=1 Tax=Paenibacillus sp. CAA11 TaxID=1532905 RepID=UPI000D3766D1|nr:DUF4247 domain-containing protein [Paenibacillus sp. CAA11]AWB44816.1 DUF4247 domain-containing protein [Paenibacillus sp. CAA11]